MTSSFKYLLIGGGLAAYQAGKMIRIKDTESSLVMISAESHLPYDRPPLSKEFLRGEKTTQDIVYAPRAYYDENNIELRLGQCVTSLDPKNKSVHLANGDTLSFDKALIATGGEPTQLDIPGAALSGVFFLRSIDDAKAIARAATKGKRVVIIGAGFIGMETAASLAQLGLSVTVVEALDHIWPRFLDHELANRIQRHCERMGVHFLTDTVATAFEGDKTIERVITAGGAELPCDLVCIGVGITPNTDIAQRAGLQIDNGVVVDECMRTSHPDIYAAGDMIAYPDPVFGRRRRVEHWGHAEYSGQVAGLNMAGHEQRYDLLSYAWSDIFDLHIEAAGDEADYDKTIIRGNIDDNSFVVLYLRENVLTAYFGVNTSSREFPKLQRLIRQRVDLASKLETLSDPSFDLKSLIPKR